MVPHRLLVGTRLRGGVRVQGAVLEASQAHAREEDDAPMAQRVHFLGRARGPPQSGRRHQQQNRGRNVHVRLLPAHLVVRGDDVQRNLSGRWRFSSVRGHCVGARGRPFGLGSAGRWERRELLSQVQMCCERTGRKVVAKTRCVPSAYETDNGLVLFVLPSVEFTFVCTPTTLFEVRAHHLYQ